LIERFKAYCEENIKEENMIKIIKVDTKLYAHEWNHETLQHIEKLAPFGEGNTEPVFSIENISIQKIEKVGNNGKSHLKIHGKIGDKTITSMFRGK
jgi:single-stranded-DNA-specific exonuclease